MILTSKKQDLDLHAYETRWYYYYLLPYCSVTVELTWEIHGTSLSKLLSICKTKIILIFLLGFLGKSLMAIGGRRLMDSSNLNEGNPMQTLQFTHSGERESLWASCTMKQTNIEIWGGSVFKDVTITTTDKDAKSHPLTTHVWGIPSLPPPGKLWIPNLFLPTHKTHIPL